MKLPVNLFARPLLLSDCVGGASISNLASPVVEPAVELSHGTAPLGRRGGRGLPVGSATGEGRAWGPSRLLLSPEEGMGYQYMLRCAGRVAGSWYWAQRAPPVAMPVGAGMAACLDGGLISHLQSGTRVRVYLVL